MKRPAPVGMARPRLYTLLTGGTGFLGRYLTRDLLARGEPLAVLARPSATATAADRVARIVAWAERDLGRPLPRPVVLDGDVTRPGMGLGADARRWADAHCGRVLHCAASLAFRGADRAAEPWRTNLTGVQAVAEFCRGAGIRNLHHVSTAYVCGTRGGRVLEADLDRGQGFRNDYEACKCAAEGWLRADPGLDLTVYRPAVVVGDSRTGYTATYHGVYRYFQITALLAGLSARDAGGRWHHPVRFRATGRERRNLVPVDWVSAAITELAGRPECRGATYHLVPARPATSGEVEAALADYFGYHGASFVGPDGLPDAAMSAYERACYGFVSDHESYVATEPVFDAANTARALPDLPCPPVDAACLRRLIDFGVCDRWGKAGRPAVAS